MAHPKSLVVRQPLKTVYTVYFIFMSIIRLLFLSVYYVARTVRPRRSWSWRVAILSEAVKLLVTYVTTIQLQISLSLEPGKERERFVKCAPTINHEAYHSRILGNNNSIKPEMLGGTWYPRRYSEKDINSKVILHFHGGAWVICDSREEVYGHGLRTLSQQFGGIPLFCPEYRLATSATGKWPAPLQDAVTSYLYLLDELKIDPSRIILSGDSAGATLVLALLRHIVDTRCHHKNTILPMPAAVLLWSPWVDTSDLDSETNHKRYDIIGPGFLQWGLQEVTNDEAIILFSDPYLSPLQSPFKIDSVPLWVQVGTAEMFYGPIQRFVRNMRAVGNTVTLYEIEDATHASLVTCVLFFQVEIEEGMRQAWEMINDISQPASTMSMHASGQQGGEACT